MKKSSNSFTTSFALTLSNALVAIAVLVVVCKRVIAAKLLGIRMSSAPANEWTIGRRISRRSKSGEISYIS